MPYHRLFRVMQFGEGKPVIMNERRAVVDILPYQVDWKDSVLFQTVLLE
jgi:hypothetical protein